VARYGIGPEHDDTDKVYVPALVSSSLHTLIRPRIHRASLNWSNLTATLAANWLRFTQ